jgi:hypothetical protein
MSTTPRAFDLKSIMEQNKINLSNKIPEKFALLAIFKCEVNSEKNLICKLVSPENVIFYVHDPSNSLTNIPDSIESRKDDKLQTKVKLMIAQ